MSASLESILGKSGAARGFVGSICRHSSLVGWWGEVTRNNGLSQTPKHHRCTSPMVEALLVRHTQDAGLGWPNQHAEKMLDEQGRLFFNPWRPMLTCPSPLA